MQLNDYFTDEAIINQLCKQRVKLAEQRNKRKYVSGFLKGSSHHHEPEQIDLLLPPRESWSKFRPPQRHLFQDLNLVSLRLATHQLRRDDPDAPWALNLDAFISRIRERVFGLTRFVFAPPQIRWCLKKKNEYRALCVFSLEDNLIACLLAKYLTHFFDPYFENCSYAFRAKTGIETAPTRDEAFNTIHQLTTAKPKQDWYVAECDIQGFYDSVDHRIALECFRQAVAGLLCRSDREMDTRAEAIFSAYLNCYNFPENVLRLATPRLRDEIPQGSFPWPGKELVKYHAEPEAAQVGVPQGGAISCLIANLVLDRADKRVKAVQEGTQSPIYYFRFCDDMILLAKRNQTCEEAFEAYLQACEELKLPFHEPKQIVYYDEAFWGAKSKHPYCWSGRKWFNCVPWIQFVGYQIRYDGLVRPRCGSVSKQKEKLKQEVSRLKGALLNPGNFVRANKRQVMMSVIQRLANMGVGKFNPKQPWKGPMPLCWTGGFKALHNKPIATASLKSMDRERDKQIWRLNKSSINYGIGRPPRGNRHAEPALGHSYSYFAQFGDNGGQDLIANPYRGNWWERRVEERVYNCAYLIHRHGVNKGIRKFLKQLRVRFPWQYKAHNLI